MQTIGLAIELLVGKVIVWDEWVLMKSKLFDNIGF
jgi:hypothetical protein